MGHLEGSSRPSKLPRDVTRPEIKVIAAAKTNRANRLVLCKPIADLHRYRSEDRVAPSPTFASAEGVLADSPKRQKAR